MPSDMNEQHKEVPPNSMLSDMDKAFMLINYPRASPHPNSPDWTLTRALDVAGVTGSARDAIIDATSADLVRQRFALWRIAQLVGGSPDSGDPANAPSQGVDNNKNNEDFLNGLHGHAAVGFGLVFEVVDDAFEDFGDADFLSKLDSGLNNLIVIALVKGEATDPEAFEEFW